MSNPEKPKNPLDELAADAPIERMRARFDELIAESPRRSGRRRLRMAWAAAALLALAGAWALRNGEPSAPGAGAEIDAVLRMLQAPSVFERLRGVNAAAGLAGSSPYVEGLLLERLRHDASVNVRLAALDVLLSPEHEAPAPGPLIEALAVQETAIVQAHLGHRLRLRRLLSRAALERLLELPAVHPETRKALSPGRVPAKTSEES